MFLFSILLRATALVIAGYFVWYCSSRSEDRLRPFGKYLALWTFAFAGLYVVASIALPAVGHRFGMMGRPGIAMMRGPMMGGMGRFGGFGGGPGVRAFMMRRGEFMHHHRDGRDGRDDQTDQNAPAAGTPAPAASGSK